MNVKKCTDELNVNGKITSLVAHDLDEMELLESVATLLYKTKSVRDTINILDRESKRQTNNSKSDKRESFTNC